MKVIGIAWEKYTSEFKSTLVRDLLSFKSQWPDLAIEICSSKEEINLAIGKGGWLIPLLALADVKYVFGKEPKAWKMYFYKNEPLLPYYAANIFKKCLQTSHERTRLRLKPDDARYPSLYRQSDNRIVPPGLSLHLNKIPPRKNSHEPFTPPANFFYSPFF